MSSSPFENSYPSPNYYRRSTYPNHFGLHHKADSPSASNYSVEKTRRSSLPDDDTSSTKDGVFKRFAETTTLQGPVLIIRSQNKCQKTLWIIAFFVAIGCWIFHSYFLIQTFLSYSTTSKVSIGYDTLPFPSVTICNINPILSSRLDEFGSDELSEYLESLVPSTDYSYDSYDGSTTTAATSSASGQSSVSSSGVSPVSDSGSSATFAGSTTVANNGGGSSNPPSSSGSTTAPTGGATTAPPGGSNILNSPPPSGRKKRQSELSSSGSEGVETSLTQDEIDEIFGSGAISADASRTETFQKLFAKLPPANRTALGTDPDLMILECSFNGLECNTSDFHLYQNTEYGNCYTFNSAAKRRTSLKSRLSGASHGLNLQLYVHSTLYIPGLKDGVGFRVAVHEYNTLPFVNDNGISVSPGLETFIGMKRYNSSLLGGRYSTCGDGGLFENYYQGKHSYTIQSCIGSCADRTISANCECFRQDKYYLYNSDDLASLPPCDMDESKTSCAQSYALAFVIGDYDCGCNQACESVDFEFTTSSNDWPRPFGWYELVSKVCQTSEDLCNYFQSQPEDYRYEVLREEFLKVRIFYRELNFVTIEERADYEWEQFVSDLGGAVGLYVGATIITLIELCYLMCQCGRVAMKKVARSQPNNTSQKPPGGVSSIGRTQDYWGNKQFRDFRRNSKGHFQNDFTSLNGNHDRLNRLSRVDANLPRASKYGV